MLNIISILVSLLTFALAAPQSYQSSASAIVAIEAAWDTSGSCRNETFTVDFNAPLQLNSVQNPQAIYLLSANGVDEQKVVCKPYWTGADGNGFMALFLTKAASSRPRDVAGGLQEVANGASLKLTCQVGTQ